MGHKLGQGVSAAHYGDYDDTEKKRDMYKKINWARGTKQRVWELERTAKLQEEKIEYQQRRIEELEQELKIRNNIRQDEIKQLRAELDEAKTITDERLRKLIKEALTNEVKVNNHPIAIERTGKKKRRITPTNSVGSL